MHSQQITWNPKAGWSPVKAEPEKVSVVFYFGTRQMLACGKRYAELREMFPAAHILGCSTGGQISNSDISDDEIVAAAISFDATRLQLVCHGINDAQQSRHCGEIIGRALRREDLAGIFVLLDGLHVNGSELVSGLVASIGRYSTHRWTSWRRCRFYGDACRGRLRSAATNSGRGWFLWQRDSNRSRQRGGWDLFGPRRQVTKSTGNVLFELDGQPALDLYERYLGPEDSKGLPGSALLFPIQVHDAHRPDSAVVRTVLAVDHKARSMTFAGDVPQGWTAQLMHGNFDRLAEGAADAARQARASLDASDQDQQFSILISCIGRRLLMGQRTSDEAEAAGAELGTDTVQLGFYSYGEISPHAKSGVCELHNQTMTVTSFAEVGA